MNYRKSISMDGLTTVFQVLALLRFAELLISVNMVSRKIIICSDSRAMSAVAKIGIIRGLVLHASA